MEKSSESKRLVNIETLRVLAMYMVVVSHYIYHGIKVHPAHVSYNITTVCDFFDYITMEPLYIFSCVSVNCYVMITGYFLVERTGLRWKALLKIFTQTLFYTLIFLLLYYLVEGSICKRQLFEACFPIYNNQYWFITKYFALILIAPFLSIIALNVTKRQYCILLLILFALNFKYLYGSVYAGNGSLMWFCFLYMVAGYIKLYLGERSGRIVRNKGILLIGTLLFLTAMVSLVNYIKHDFQLRSSANDEFTFIMSLVVFVFFIYSHITNRLLIKMTKIAPYTLGVYLLHTNPNLSKILGGGGGHFLYS